MNKKEKIQIKYDGEALKSHSIDVAILAPALMAFGELCTQSNKIINGEDSELRVYVHADLKANCITIDIEIIQSIIKQTFAFINKEHIVDLKTLLEWIGIFSGSALALFSLIAKLSKRNIKKITYIESNNILIFFENEPEPQKINKNIYKLSENQKVVKNIKELIKPVAVNEGIDSLNFSHNKKSIKINKDIAKEIYSYKLKDEDTEGQYLIGHIIVHSITFDSKSKKWKFWYNNRIEIIDISKTNIAQDSLNRGKVLVGDTYKVKLEIIEKKLDSGKYKNEYKVIEVLQYIPGTEQTELNL